jgi:hypothetical protein
MPRHSDGAGDEQVQPTAQQRLAALEENVAGLREMIDTLHRMLKEQENLIREYITKQLTTGDPSGNHAGGISPEDALFTFVCRRKFDQVEKELGRLRQLLIGPDSIRRAS